MVAVAMRSAFRTGPRPRVMLLEWTDPPFSPGHWVPEMIEVAGGEPLLGVRGEKSRRVTWDEVHAAEPDVIVVAPCGYDLAGAQVLADELVASGVLPDGVPVHAVDANASWARPGTRLIDGIDELSQLLATVQRGSGQRSRTRLQRRGRRAGPDGSGRRPACRPPGRARRRRARGAPPPPGPARSSRSRAGRRTCGPRPCR